MLFLEMLCGCNLVHGLLTAGTMGYEASQYYFRIKVNKQSECLGSNLITHVYGSTYHFHLHQPVHMPFVQIFTWTC